MNEGLLFLLTGLQARTVIEGLGLADGSRLMFHGVIISLLVIVIRFVCVYSVGSSAGSGTGCRRSGMISSR